MKLRVPCAEEAQFVTIIDDCDADEIEVAFHKDQAAAEQHLNEQYGDIPDSGEPDGNRYDEGEQPNADVSVVRVMLARVLRRTLL